MFYKTINLVNGQVRLKGDVSVGPAHDPYSRDETTFVDHDGNVVWKYVVCGLAGETFYHADLGATFVKSVVGREVFEAMVDVTTGFSTAFWERDVWEYKERSAIARMGFEEYARQCEMEEMDTRLLSYAM
tara:strand:+ start:728 stop:1117 length:390 start_codon:yes stop_codon:yes gene_type:complete